MKQFSRYLIVAVLTAFAVLTLFLSTSVIFDFFGIREKEGNYVLSVVWSNFISSILYLISAYGLATLKKWTFKPLALSALILVLSLVVLLVHIQSGGLYETKTIGAMVFRIILTIGFSLFAYFTINRSTVSSK
jgi:hypothetical protein